MFRASASWTWILLLAAGVVLSLDHAPGAQAQEDVRQRLAAGEIIVTIQDLPGASAKRGEALGVINAPPGIVWQVVTDINNYKFFMPRTLNSKEVAADKVPLILQRRPERVEEVEQLLGAVPAAPPGPRVPGGKYICYLYSHLNFPWPCSNRWYIIKLVQDETRAAQQSYRCSWSLVIGNLRENLGEWLIEPFDATRTKLTYRLTTDPGGNIPGFLAEKGTCTSLSQIITAIRKRADNVGGRK